MANLSEIKRENMLYYLENLKEIDSYGLKESPYLDVYK